MFERNYHENPLSRGEYIPKEEILEIYINQNTSKKKTCEFFNITMEVLKRHLKTYNIIKPKHMWTECCKKSMVAKYGVENIFQCKDFIRQKVREKYGVDYAMQCFSVREKQKQTCLEKYGVEHVMQNPQVKNKVKNIFNNKYGGNAPICSEEIKQKIKNTNLQKYGTESAAASPQIRAKIENTNLQKYGCKCVFGNKDIQKKIKNTWKQKYGTEYGNQSEIVKQHIRESMIEKYGVPYMFHLPNWQDISKKGCLKKYGVDHPVKSAEVQKKIRATTKCHNNMTCSKSEEYIYEQLCLLFGKEDIFRQYEDERYPFNCDFYIKSLDLFIEFQGFRGHNGHPYNPQSEEDRKTVEYWRQKSQEINYKGQPKTQYISFIDTWTIKDPIKRLTALENNLNWIEFFNLKEFNDWFNILHK